MVKILSGSFMQVRVKTMIGSSNHDEDDSEV